MTPFLLSQVANSGYTIFPLSSQAGERGFTRSFPKNVSILYISGRQKESLGPPRPQTPRQGMIPCTPPGDRLESKSMRFSPAAGSYDIRAASGPRKAGKIPGGKLAFPWGLFPGFSRMLCIRVGVLRTPGQKHNGGKHGGILQATAGNCLFSASSRIRKRGSRGVTPLVEVWRQSLQRSLSFQLTGDLCGMF